jgi:ABC-type tungstate transport system substrate-binding protein
MDFLKEGVRQAVSLIWNWNADLTNIVAVTMRVALWSTLFAMLIGLPIALVLAITRFPGRRVLIAFFNAGRRSWSGSWCRSSSSGRARSASCTGSTRSTA